MRTELHDHYLARAAAVRLPAYEAAQWATPYESETQAWRYARDATEWYLVISRALALMGQQGHTATERAEGLARLRAEAEEIERRSWAAPPRGARAHYTSWVFCLLLSAEQERAGQS